MVDGYVSNGALTCLLSPESGIIGSIGGEQLDVYGSDTKT
jgi:hypothetical protein